MTFKHDPSELTQHDEQRCTCQDLSSILQSSNDSGLEAAVHTFAAFVELNKCLPSCRHLRATLHQRNCGVSI
jgi:hypothetical protein